MSVKGVGGGGGDPGVYFPIQEMLKNPVVVKVHFSCILRVILYITLTPLSD